uniref:(northern house mosquito) hypothetical protein n=1 Tax=Culex pipiens TaxID=7175 RepID=A0A8D8EST7_CULPI
MSNRSFNLVFECPCGESSKLFRIMSNRWKSCWNFANFEQVSESFCKKLSSGLCFLVTCSSLLREIFRLSEIFVASTSPLKSSEDSCKIIAVLNRCIELLTLSFKASSGTSSSINGWGCLKTSNKFLQTHLVSSSNSFPVTSGRYFRLQSNFSR